MSTGAVASAPAARLSITVSRVSMVVPCRAKTLPSIAAENTTSALEAIRWNVDWKDFVEGRKLSPVMTTRRPSDARRASADRTC